MSEIAIVKQEQQSEPEKQLLKIRSPEEMLLHAQKKLSDESHAIADRMEHTITTLIIEQWHGGTITFAVEEQDEMAVVEVIRRFEIAGWLVTVANQMSPTALIAGKSKPMPGHYQFQLRPRWWK